MDIVKFMAKCSKHYAKFNLEFDGMTQRGVLTVDYKKYEFGKPYDGIMRKFNPEFNTLPQAIYQASQDIDLAERNIIKDIQETPNER